MENYKGDFGGHLFSWLSDQDPHVPIERFYATSNILKNMNAIVTEKVYANLGHTINEDEMEHVNRMIQGR